MLTIYVKLPVMTYDVIIRNGLWFDGTGKAPQTRTLGIRDGVVSAVSAGPLDETVCPDVIDAAGKWIVPGFIDVHTHYDAEVLLDPACVSRCGTASPRSCWATARCGDLCRLRGRRRSFQPGRGGASRARHRCAGCQQDVVDRR